MIVLRDYSELGQWGGAPVALTVGFFDGVHQGHRHLLERLRAQADRLAARSLVVTFSNSPRGFHHPDKHWRYLTLPEEKLSLLAASGVDAVLMLRYTDSVARQSAALFLRGLDHFAKVAGITVGYDSSIGSDMLRGEAQYAALAERLGVELDFVLPYPPGAPPVKSSAIRERIAAGDVAGARSLLGHRYFVMGTVAGGKGKGAAALSTPTANIYLPQEKLTPPMGIYAGAAVSEGARYPAAICLVSRAQALRTVLERDSAPPAVDDPAAVVVEAHLLGFAGNLYGRALTVQFHDWLRDFRDFDDPAALKAQIAQDITATQRIYEEIDD